MFGVGLLRIVAFAASTELAVLKLSSLSSPIARSFFGSIDAAAKPSDLGLGYISYLFFTSILLIEVGAELASIRLPELWLRVLAYFCFGAIYFLRYRAV